MLDPRIYRMSLVVAALALVVLAFSLADQPAALRSSLAPAAFNGANVHATMARVARSDPSRTPGSDGDNALANEVASSLGAPADGFTVTRDTFSARTVDGERTLQNVVATRPGTQSGSGSVVIVAARDGRGSGAAAGLSGTATLLELGRDLGGETLSRTVVLASTTATDGMGGAMRLASTLPRPVDAVIVLGDLASAQRRQPTVVPWSTAAVIAPPQLRNTLSAALSSQSSVRTSSPGVLAQLAHLAFPLTTSPQAPFGAAGAPAVELSLSGERGPAAGGPTVGSGQLTAVGRSILSAISALSGGAAVARPSSYVLFKGKVVPGWAMSLFVLALIIPVILTTIDGVARARRRGYLVGRSLRAALGAAMPFLAALVVVLLGRAVGLMPWAPGPVQPGTVAVTGGAVAVLAVAVLAALATGFGVRAAFASLAAADPARGSRDRRVKLVDRSGDGTAAAMLLVLCVATLLIWAANPIAAALLVPALHLWLWAIDSDLELPLPVRLAMLALGVVPIAGLVTFYADSLGFGPGGLAWEAALLLAGHVVSPLAAVEWSVVLGCLVTAVVLVVSAARRPAASVAPAVTVRGPATYAGPGSLGGTKSALRR